MVRISVPGKEGTVWKDDRANAVSIVESWHSLAVSARMSLKKRGVGPGGQ